MALRSPLLRALPAARGAVLALAMLAVAGDPPAPGAVRELVIAATGDLNGWIERRVLYPEERRGLAHLAPVIRGLRAEHPGLILLDAGDALAGAPATARWRLNGARGEPPALRVLRRLGYDAAVPGNLDAGLGAAALERLHAATGFPWTAANVRGPGGAPVFPPYRVVERHGVRVAVLGGLTPGVAMWVPAARRAGWRVGDLEAASRRWVARLRREAGADVVVGLFHSGLDGGYDRAEAVRNGVALPNVAGRIADTVPGIDLVVSGHAHRLRPRRPTGGAGAYAVPVIEAGSRGNGLAVAELTLRRESGAWRVIRVRRRTLGAVREPDPEVLAQAQPERTATRAWLAEPAAVRIAGVPSRRAAHRCAGALVHAAARRLGRAAGHGEVGYSLLPMLWRGVVPAPDDVGRRVTRADVYRWMPYENALVRSRLTGRQTALLLTPWRRWERDLAVDGGDVLYPGGLEPMHRPGGTEVTALRDAATGVGLPLHTPYAVWLTAYHWAGAGALAARALLHPDQRGPTLPGPLREAVFRLLGDETAALPEKCRGWLERDDVIGSAPQHR